MTDPTTIATFAAVGFTLYAAHEVGDHWVQTSAQAADKGRPGWPGRLADARHVLTLTVTKLVFLSAVWLVLDLPLTAAGLVAGLGVDSASHWWADRRTTLARLAAATGKGEFYALGSSADPTGPVNADGKPASHLGLGSYALDKAWHVGWLIPAALLIAAL